MSIDVEQRLAAELRRRAEATTTSASAVDDIRARAAARPGAAADPPGRAPRWETPRWETPSWRRPLVALAAAVVLLAVALVAVERGVDDQPADPAHRLPPVQALPDRAPALVGSLVGGIHVTQCLGFCIDGAGTVDVAASTGEGAVRRLVGRPLRDGRQVMPRTGGWWAVDPATGDGVRVADEYPVAIDVLTDDRVVTFRGPDEDDPRAELVLVDTSGTTTRLELPEGFTPHGLGAGPDGWLAVVGGQCGCRGATDPDVHLLLVAPDGHITRRDIDEAVEDMPGPVLAGALTPSWGPNGLVALSTDQAAPIDGERGPTLSRTVVVDPTTGRRVADIPGWHALAWSPDGTGLIGARRTGPATTRLRLFWGPALDHHTDLGELDQPLTPWWWLPGAPGY